MVDHVLACPEDTRLMILSPLIVGRRGEQHDLVEDLRAQGFVRLRIDGEVHDIDQLPKLAKNKKHTIDVVVDRVKVRADVKQRLAESFETALRHSDGRALAVEIDSGREHIFSARFACPLCSYSLPELEPRLFSFNNPMGACPRCDGLGSVSFFDPARVVAFPSLPLASGAVKGWDRRNQFYFQMLQGLSAHYGFDLETPFEQLPEAVRKVVLYGSGRDKIRFTYSGERGRSHTREHAFEGVVANLERRYKETESGRGARRARQVSEHGTVPRNARAVDCGARRVTCSWARRPSSASAACGCAQCSSSSTRSSSPAPSARSPKRSSVRFATGCAS
jgi:excinuclease ABC subunit A